jgi:hypothetical protein
MLPSYDTEIITSNYTSFLVYVKNLYRGEEREKSRLRPVKSLRARPLQNDTKVVISSSPGKSGMTEKGVIQRSPGYGEPREREKS